MPKVNLEANAHLHVNIDGKERISELEKEVALLKRRLMEADSELQHAGYTIEDLRSKLEKFKNSDLGTVTSELERFQETAKSGAQEIERLLRALRLNDAIGDTKYVTEALDAVKRGAITVGRALSGIKSEFKYLFEESYNKSGGLFDAQMVNSFTASLDMVVQKLGDVSDKVNAMLQNGVPTVGGGGGGGAGGAFDISSVLDKIRVSVEGMSEEARAAYEPITRLMVKLTEYANLDTTRILGVSQAFRNIAAIGDGVFSDKKIANITKLLNLLETVNGSKLSSIQFDPKGFNELHVRKASLSNLAEYLPKIQKVSATKLQELSKVNLTNFNNVKVSKASLNAIADLSNYQDSLRLLKDTIDQVVASINTLNKSMTNGGVGNGGNGGSGDVKALAEEDILRRMADASTRGHRLLEGNVQSKDMVAYRQFNDTLEEIDTILVACDRDAAKLPAALNSTSMEEAAAKANSLLTQLSALRNELTFTENAGTFSRKNINDTLNSMLTLRNKSGNYSNTAEFKNLEAQIRLFGDALQYCKQQGVSLNDAFVHFGTDGKSAIDAANTAMSALKLKVTETAQGIADSKILDKAAVSTDWKVRGLEEKDINSMYAQVKKLADGSNFYNSIKQKYNELIDLQELWKAQGSDLTSSEVANITKMREELKTLMESYIRVRERISELQKTTAANQGADTLTRWKISGIEEKDIEALHKQVGKLPGDADKLKEIEKLYENLTQMQNRWKHNGSDLTAPEVDSIEKLRIELKALMEEYIEVGKAANEASEAQKRSKTAELNAKWESQGLTASNIKSLFGKAEKNKELFDDFDAVRKQYESVLKAHEALDKKNLDPARAKAVEDETRKLKELIETRLAENEARRKAFTDDANRSKQLQKIGELQNRIAKNQNDWTKAKTGKSREDYEKLAEYNNELDVLANRLRSGSISTKEFERDFADLNMRYKESAGNIKLANENTKSFVDRIKGLASKFGSWFGITRIIMSVVRAIRKMITNAKEIDAAMTQLKIVTNATDNEMKQFSNTATELAKNLGKSVVELTKSIETFSRLGYSLSDAAELAKYATIMSNVASVNADEATTGLTAIVKGYNLDVADAEHVADVLVEVGQKYAVSAAEMMEAYEKSGAALHATNTSLEKSAGLIAAANASVQDASVVGKEMPSLTVM